MKRDLCTLSEAVQSKQVQMACYRLTCLNCQRCVTHIFIICTIVLTHLYFLDVHLWTAFLWAYLQVPKADKSDLCLDVLPAQSPYKGK